MNNSPNLLIVDDSPENLMLIEAITRKVNVTLIKASSGQEALNKVDGVELALAIIDVRMPGMNGYELAIKMNEKRAEENVPVIFLTASHFSEIERLKGYGSGAIDFIFRPVDNQILLSKINAFLNLYLQKQTVVNDIKERREMEKKLRGYQAELEIKNKELSIAKEQAELALLQFTERRKAERTLQESENKYKIMLNASPDGIILIDLNGIITEVSVIGLGLLGEETKDDILGINISEYVPSNEKKALEEMIEKTLSEGLTQNIGLAIKKKNQTVFPGEVSATLVQGSDGEPMAFMIIIRDISQRKKAETIQIHADRMMNLGEMASGIAHEINQPLNNISMVMDRILFEIDRTETVNVGFVRERSEKIFDNIIRIRNIIDHIRAFSRNDDNYVLSFFNINTSITNAISIISEQFKFLGIILDLKLDDQVAEIFGNTYKFEQVIVNLMINAKDAVIERKNSNTDYSEMTVGIRSFAENQFVIVEITDNGIGILNDNINNVMLPFFTTKEEGKGTGLGLSICYQIIKEMGGTIEIINTRASETKIRIALDVQKNKKK